MTDFEEMSKSDKELFEIAKRVETDKALGDEMEEWGVILNDELE